MTYPYQCTKCRHFFDVVKSVKDIDVTESCPKCGEFAQRQFTANVHFMGTAVEHPRYDVAFGQVIKNKKQRSEIAKRKGWEEVGNEKPDKIHKHFENQRIETRKERWESV